MKLSVCVQREQYVTKQRPLFQPKYFMFLKDLFQNQPPNILKAKEVAL